MGRQINFLGSSIWLPSDDADPTTNTNTASAHPLYSPLTLATYCIFINMFIGTLLYGLNLSRRGYVFKGRMLITLSSLMVIVSTFSASRAPFVSPGSRALLNGLVAVSLFTTEYTHFQRAKRRGIQPARWWPPLIGVVLASAVGMLI